MNGGYQIERLAAQAYRLASAREERATGSECLRREYFLKRAKAGGAG